MEYEKPAIESPEAVQGELCDWFPNLSFCKGGSTGS
jgi:hypothetical protein